MKPLVSAIIVTHNRLPLLEKAADSVLKQTWQNLELIVVDDGSTDGTRERMEQLSARLGFTYIRNTDGLGGNHVRNIGILQASGKYIALLDDDDEWLPEKTEKQVRLLEAHPEIGVVSCGRIGISENGQQTPEDPFTLPEGDLSRIIFTDLHFTTSRLMFRKDLLETAGLFDESLKAWQDYELMLRLCQMRLLLEQSLIKKCF